MTPGDRLARLADELEAGASGRDATCGNDDARPARPDLILTVTVVATGRPSTVQRVLGWLDSLRRAPRRGGG